MDGLPLTFVLKLNFRTFLLEYTLNFEYANLNLWRLNHSENRELELGSHLRQISRNDHVIMFMVYLPLDISSFSVKSMCSFFLRNTNANLTFAACNKRDSKTL